MLNLKFDFSRYKCAVDQSLVRALPLGGAPSPCGLTHLSKPDSLYHSNISLKIIILPFFHDNFILSLYFSNNWRLYPRYYDYFDKLLRLDNVKLFSRQDKILCILDTTISILYRKLYINIVSIILLNIEARQHNIKTNLPILLPKVI